MEHLLENNDQTFNAIQPVVTPLADEQYQDPKSYLEIPYTYQNTGTESVALNSGALQYEHTDFVLPGKNGFDLKIARRYDSFCSNTMDMKPTYTTVQMYTYRIWCDYIWLKAGGRNYTLRNKLVNIGTDVLTYDAIVDMAETQVSRWESTHQAGWELDYFEYYENDRLVRINHPTIASDGEFSATYQTFGVKGVLQTSSRENAHLRKTYGLGYGWGFVLPSIEIVPDGDNISGHTFLHLQDGRCFSIRGNTLEDHKLQDITIQNAAGTITHPSRAGSSWAYAYTVTYKNGDADYFASNGKLVGRKDRFGNTIIFSMVDYGGMTIIDSWGRNVVLSKSGGMLTWTLPDNETVRYMTDGFKLTRVFDQIGDSTVYAYSSKSAVSRYASPDVGDTSNVSFSYQLLTSVQLPSGTIAEYAYGYSNADTPMETALENTGGFRRAFPILSRKDKVGSTEYNYTSYAYTLSDDQKYIQTAVVSKNNGVKFVQTFNDKNQCTEEKREHGGTQVERTIYTYGTGDTNDKLPTQERFYRHGIHCKTTAWSYSTDKKGNITKIEETYPQDPDYNQTTEMAYDGTYSLLTQKTVLKDASAVLIERYALQSNKKLTEYRRIFEKVGTVETLMEKSQYVYDSNNRLTQERRYYGSPLTDSSVDYLTTTYAYNSEKYTPKPVSKTVVGVKNADGANATAPIPGTIVERYDYDACGRTIKKTDGNGNSTDYTYNIEPTAFGPPARVVAETHPAVAGVRKTRYTNYAGSFTESGNENGDKIRTTYSLYGKSWRTYSPYPDTLLSECTYDSLGRLASEKTFYATGVIKATTAYTYDLFDRVITKKITGSGVNYVETHVYNDNYQNKYLRDQCTVSDDENDSGIVSITLTDIVGNTYQETMGDTTTTHFYNKIGNRTKTTDARNNSTLYTYDYAGRVLRETNALNQYIENNYDALGNKKSVRNLAGQYTYYTYDVLGRMLIQDFPFDTSQRTQTRHYYDGAGNLIWEKTQIAVNQWRETEYRYDARGRQTDVFQYKNAARNQYAHTRTIYDGVGNRLQVHTGLTQNAADTASVTTYTYDQFGNVLSMKDPLGQTERHEYDETGRLIAKIDRKGSRTAYTYDALERLTKETVAVTNPSETLITEHVVSYTRTGQKATESDSEVVGDRRKTLTIAYEYDNMGRVREQTESDSENSANITVKTYTYDANGNRSSFMLKRNGATQISLTYDYDKLNRMTAVKNALKSGVTIASYVYDTNGNRTAFNYPVNGVSTRYEYNRANLVTLLENRRGSTIASKWSYTYQLDGNQVSKADKAGRTTTYAYDLLGRLYRESDPDWNTIVYEYDRFGNRTKMTVSGAETYTTRYEYDRNNRLTLESKQEDAAQEQRLFGYDANGNQTGVEWSRSDNALPESTIGRVGFVTEDFHGDDTALDLREYDGFGRLVKVYRDSVQTRYRYRPDGLRHSKTTGISYKSRSNDATTTHYWDGGNIVMETGTNGSTKARYLRGVNLVCQQIDNNDFYYLFNAHGDVVQRVGSTGIAAPEYIYDAFGNQREPVKIDPNPFRYCGEYFDKSSGTYYLRNRDYNPAIGRFTSEDIARDGLNWYTYCNGNPLRYVDPSGLAARTPKSDRQWVFYYGWAGQYDDSEYAGIELSLEFNYKVWDIAEKHGMDPWQLMILMATESKFATQRSPYSGKLSPLSRH